MGSQDEPNGIVSAADLIAGYLLQPLYNPDLVRGVGGLFEVPFLVTGGR